MLSIMDVVNDWPMATAAIEVTAPMIEDCLMMVRWSAGVARDPSSKGRDYRNPCFRDTGWEDGEVFIARTSTKSTDPRSLVTA